MAYWREAVCKFIKKITAIFQINGVDVRCASHDQVVRLIQMSGDTISLKVITIGSSSSGGPVQPYYGTLPSRRKSSCKTYDCYFGWERTHNT